MGNEKKSLWEKARMWILTVLITLGAFVHAFPTETTQFINSPLIAQITLQQIIGFLTLGLLLIGAIKWLMKNVK